jgi:hypothetical protein
MANSDSAERDPFVDPPMAAASEQSADATTATLACVRDVTLTLGSDGLVVIGKIFGV